MSFLLIDYTNTDNLTLVYDTQKHLTHVRSNVYLPVLIDDLDIINSHTRKMYACIYVCMLCAIFFLRDRGTQLRVSGTILLDKHLHARSYLILPGHFRIIVCGTRMSLRPQIPIRTTPISSRVLTS